MIKLELLVLLGLVIGLPLGWLARIAWTRFLAYRDRKITVQVEKEYVRLRLPDVPTEEMLEELSTRSFGVETDHRMPEHRK